MTVQPFSIKACSISATTRFSPMGLFQLVPSLMLKVLYLAKFAALSKSTLTSCAKAAAPDEAQRGRNGQCAYLHTFLTLLRP